MKDLTYKHKIISFFGMRGYTAFIPFIKSLNIEEESSVQFIRINSNDLDKYYDSIQIQEFNIFVSKMIRSRIDGFHKDYIFEKVIDFNNDEELLFIINNTNLMSVIKYYDHNKLPNILKNYFIL